MSESLSEPCCKCGNAAIRLIGASAYCNECAERLLAPLRLKHGVVRQIDDEWVGCSQCGAEWQIDPDSLKGRMQDGCPFCKARFIALRNRRRDELLQPAWLNYEPILPQNIDEWAKQLAHAATAQLITIEEATKALARYVKPSRGIQQ